MFQEKEDLEIALNCLFEGINTETITKFASPKNVIGKKEGDIIYQKGDATDYLYLLIEGIVKLKFTEPDGTNVYINKDKNTFFGETEMLANTARKSSAVADTDCRMYTINISELKSICKADKLIYKNLLNNYTIDISEEEFSDYLRNNLNVEPDFSKIAETTEKLSFNPELDELDNSDSDATIDNDISFNNILTTEEEVEDDKSKTETNNPEILEENDEGEEETGYELKDPIGEDEDTNDIPFLNKENLSEILNNKNEESLKSMETKLIPSPSFELNEIPGTFENEIPVSDVNNKSFSKSPEYYEAIIKSIRSIFSKTSLDETANSIAEACAELLKTAGGVLYTSDNELEELTAQILSGDSISRVRVKFSDGLQGIAAKEKREIIIDKPRENGNFNPVIEDLTGIKMKNILYYPILNNSGESIGVLELFNSERGEFNSRDIEIIDTIRPFIMQALSNARMNEIFIQRKRVESIGELTKFLSDNIKLPVLNIKHYASILKKKINSKEVKRVLDFQIEQADSVEEFLKSVLAFSSSENIINPESTKLSDALDKMLVLLAEYVESQNVVIYKKLDADAIVNLDQNQFSQACYQIAQSACDSMAEDGKIYITTETDGDYIKIKFRDTGTGIPESIRQNIFKPFYSKDKHQLSGIGLSIAEKIISDHGGYLMVDSVVGVGSTFIISLPIVF